MQSSLQSLEKYDLLNLGGEIDLDCSHRLRGEILASLESGKSLLIDLSDVEYIDSSGIVTLLEGYQAAKTAKLSYGLLNVSSTAMQVLSLTRLDKVFSIYNRIDKFQKQL